VANKIEIPISFKLNGKPVSVELDNAYCSDNNCYGEADFTDNIITLCSCYKGEKLSKRIKDQTYYHELAHLLFHAAGLHKQKWNEDLIDKIGLLLYEYERTKK
jgi:hypothetical protein